MIKTLMGSIRDYMKVTVATPLLVLCAWQRCRP